MIKERKTDPLTFSVMGAQLDAIVREMTLIMTYTGRSTIFNCCHDFSVTIASGGEKAEDIRVLSMYAGLPLHCIGIELAVRPILELYEKDDIREGDMFLNNCAYYGGSHHADYTTMSPIFFEGEIMFWAVVRCHQNDIGYHQPDTYAPFCKDIYEEGPNFPVVRIQRDYKAIQDWVRFFQINIRYPEQMWGDHMAQAGGIRIGERRLREFCQKHGKEKVKLFVEEWLDYSEALMVDKIRRLGKTTRWGLIFTDPFDFRPDGIPIVMKIETDPDEAMITVDLTENVDNVPAGINTTEQSGQSGVCSGLGPTVAGGDIPMNAGMWRRVRFKLREGCIVGIPRFPTSCACGTSCLPPLMSDLAARIISDIDPKLGASGCSGSDAAEAVLGGRNPRRNYEPYGHEFFAGGVAGPSTEGYDGWPYWLNSICSGTMKTEPIELIEMRDPHFVMELRVLKDSAGPGQWRGGPGWIRRVRLVKDTPPVSIAAFGDTSVFPPPGAQGGKYAIPNVHWLEDLETGKVKEIWPQKSLNYLHEGEVWGVISSGGAGYGDPLRRDAERVRSDVMNDFVSLESARDDYGVVLKPHPTKIYEVDYEGTKKLRGELASKKTNEPAKGDYSRIMESKEEIEQIIEEAYERVREWKAKGKPIEGPFADLGPSTLPMIVKEAGLEDWSQALPPGV